MGKTSKYIFRQHEIKTFLVCRKKFQLQVLEGWRPRITKDYFNLGAVFDKAAAEYHCGTSVGEVMAGINAELKLRILKASDQEEIDSLEKMEPTIQGMLYGYVNNFKQINFEPHYRVIVPVIQNFKLSCELDGRWTDKKQQWIIERKAVQNVDADYVKRLDIDFQMNCYFYALRKWTYREVTGVLYRITKKPSIRQKQNESKLQFTKRLMLEYEEFPEKYFFEEKIFKDQSTNKIFEQEIQWIFEDLKECLKNKRFYRSDHSCSPIGAGKCPYLEYCKKPERDTLETFYKKEK